TSLEDAAFFDEKIQTIVRGPEQGHDLTLIRRYFRAYLHCWKTVLHFVREAKGLKKDKDWARWCTRWQSYHLDGPSAAGMEQMRMTRDYDTHWGGIVLSGEIAAGLFPLVFLQPVASSQVRRELVTFTAAGIRVIAILIKTHGSFK